MDNAKIPGLNVAAKSNGIILKSNGAIDLLYSNKASYRYVYLTREEKFTMINLTIYKTVDQENGPARCKVKFFKVAAPGVPVIELRYLSPKGCVSKNKSRWYHEDFKSLVLSDACICVIVDGRFFCPMNLDMEVVKWKIF